MRISDWSSDVCSSDLWVLFAGHFKTRGGSFLKIEVVENAACNRRLILMLARLSSDLSIHGRCETRLGREVVVWIEPICLKNNDGLDRREMDRKSTRLNSSH